MNDDALMDGTALRAGDRARRRRTLTLGSCCAAHVLQDGLSAALYVLMPVLGQAFGLSYAQIGVIRAANNTAMALLEVPSGVLAERFGERILLVLGLAGAGLAYLALTGAGGFAGILACLVAAGVGGAFQHALASAVITRTFAAEGRRSALGIYNSSGDAGKLAFTGLATLALAAGFGWPAIVGALGAAALAGALAVGFVLGRCGAGARPSGTRAGGVAHARSGWGIRDRGAFAVLCVVVLSDIAVQTSFLTFLAFVMLEKTVPTSLAALAVVVTLVGGTFGKLGCGLLAERVGVLRSLVAAQVLTALGIVAVLLVPSLGAFLLLPLLGPLRGALAPSPRPAPVG